MYTKEHPGEVTAALTVLNHLRKEKNIQDDELINIICDSLSIKCAYVPSKVLANRDIGVLEAVVKYLKEERGMKYCEIARALNRDQRTIWCSYKNAKRKKK